MKKTLILMLLALLTTIGIVGAKNNGVFAKTHKTTERGGDITSQVAEIISIKGGNLLSYYDDDFKINYLKEMKKKKKKFIGNRIDYLNAGIQVDMVHSIIEDWYNDLGATQKYTLSESRKKKVTTVVTIQANKSYGLKATPVKGFEGKANSDLGINVKTTVEVATERSVQKVLTIPPGAKLVRSIKATGNVYNGAYQRYAFWIRVASGLFEYCTMSNVRESIDIITDIRR